MICSFLSAYNLTNVRYPSVCQSQKRLRVCTFVERKSETFFLSYLLIYSQLPYNRRVVTHCRIVQNYANLSRREFDDLLKQSQLRICLVGMSNCGKTLRSLQLAQQFGFERFCVDDKIEQQISNVLQVQGYSSGIEGVAKWMGYPFEERFYRNQELYLKRSFVLDTTVVHLEAPEDMLQEMIQLYFEAPKPVIWGDSFQPLPNEDGISALKRCYPQLLRFRLKRYQQFAHCSVPASVSMNSAFDIDQFIEKIRECLPK
ncbi:hypothetical protein Gasu2_48940 [Galdieria sulphuraria]|nr:hypothetical protein Gasu2_48940 [Galdieria sulphuraria]